MSDQFMQEVQAEEHSIEDLERKISQGTGIGDGSLTVPPEKNNFINTLKAA